MSSTINNSVTGKGMAASEQIGEQASKGNGGGGPRRLAGLVASAALGVSLLAGIVISQVRPAAQDADPPAAVNPIVSDTHVASMWDFREDRRAETRDLWVADQFTYREDHRAASPVAAVQTSAEIAFLEGNLYLGSTSAFYPDQFTYREDHRVGQASAFVPDQFTYREDRRVGASNDFVPDFWTYREDRRDH